MSMNYEEFKKEYGDIIESSFGDRMPMSPILNTEKSKKIKSR